MEMKFPLYTVLHAYQLENYIARRFLRFIYTHPIFWIRGSQRQIIDRTSKAYTLVVCIFLLRLGLIVGSYFLRHHILATIGIALLFIPFVPVGFVLVHTLLLPLDRYAKMRIIARARRKIRGMRHLTIIGITGSFGKTSQKDILAHVLGKKYNVLTTEGNKNTLVGVARLILEKLTKEHSLFIVEMGAWNTGDIKKLCKLVRPQIGILTGITTQHVERFGSLEAIIDAKFELLEALPKDGIAILNFSDINVQHGREKRKKYIQTKEIVQIPSVHVSYKQQFGGIEFVYDKQKFSSILLAKHSAIPLIVAYEVGKQLCIKERKMIEQVATVPFVQHRLQVIRNVQTGVTVIDDSYNGNIEGVRSTIDILQHSPSSGRKVYMTPGLVELGPLTESLHVEIGTSLASAVDLVLLIDSVASRSIKAGLLSAGFPEEQIRTYACTQDAHDDLPNVLQSGDVIVFQNDWTDTYF